MLSIIISTRVVHFHDITSERLDCLLDFPAYYWSAAVIFVHIYQFAYLGDWLPVEPVVIDIHHRIGMCLILFQNVVGRHQIARCKSVNDSTDNVLRS